MPKEIKLVLKGNIIVPEDAPDGPASAATAAGRSKLRQGDEVRFTLGEEFTSASVTFVNTSPFDEPGSLTYGKSHTLSKSAAPGIYRYDCAATDLKGNEHHSAGGGEVEIIGL